MPARLDTGFPWLTHRTLAEVAETERLTALVRNNPRTKGGAWPRLNALLHKAAVNNPPAVAKEGERA